MKYLILPLIILLLTNGVDAQSSRPYKGYDERFEGQKEIQITAPDFELISLIGFRQKVQENQVDSLRIRFFVPDTQGTNKLYLIARELEVSSKYYLMRPNKIEWEKGEINEFSSWPTKDVLEPLQISGDEIGLIGWFAKEGEGSGLIAPIILYYSTFPDSIQNYQIHFRSKYTLDSLRITIQDLDSAQEIISKKFSTISGQNTNYLNVDFTDMVEAFYKIIIKGRRIDEPNAGPYREYTFYHKSTY